MDLIEREKALGCFWNYANNDGTGYDETDMPAYDRLQALPIVKEVDDCISRQDAIKAFKDFLTIHDSRGVEYLCSAVTMDGVNRILSDLPSAQPERKKGKWIKISPANIYECSVCGQSVMTNDIETYKFCHGCGADMRGEENDSQ